jgi:dTDP-4-amino-4,6-dideoxygalactose transaminase
VYLETELNFIDSDRNILYCPEILGICIKTVLPKEKKNLKAIIAVHLWNAFKASEIMSVFKYEIPLIERLQEALGSSYKGQNVGLWNNNLSFNGNKITTSGGGAFSNLFLENLKKT